MDDGIKERLTRRSIWLRALFMLFFALAFAIAELLIWTLAIVQFFIILFTDRANEPLLRFGNNLCAYIYGLFRFITFNTEQHPFPFSDWPDEEFAENPWLHGEFGANGPQHERGDPDKPAES